MLKARLKLFSDFLIKLIQIYSCRRWCLVACLLLKSSLLFLSDLRSIDLRRSLFRLFFGFVLDFSTFLVLLNRHFDWLLICGTFWLFVRWYLGSLNRFLLYHLLRFVERSFMSLLLRLVFWLLMRSFLFLFSLFLLLLFYKLLFFILWLMSILRICLLRTSCLFWLNCFLLNFSLILFFEFHFLFRLRVSLFCIFLFFLSELGSWLIIIFVILFLFSVLFLAPFKLLCLLFKVKGLGSLDD